MYILLLSLAYYTVQVSYLLYHIVVSFFSHNTIIDFWCISSLCSSHNTVISLLWFLLFILPYSIFLIYYTKVLGHLTINQQGFRILNKKSLILSCSPSCSYNRYFPASSGEAFHKYFLEYFCGSICPFIQRSGTDVAWEGLAHNL